MLGLLLSSGTRGSSRAGNKFSPLLLLRLFLLLLLLLLFLLLLLRLRAGPPYSTDSFSSPYVPSLRDSPLCCTHRL